MATIYKRGESYTLNYYESGKQIRKSLGKITEAEAQAAKIAIERKLNGQKPASSPLFAEWSQDYAIWHSTKYPDSYFRVESALRVHLIPFFGMTPISAIKRRDVETYKQLRMQTGAAPATVSKELRTLQASLNKAVEWEMIDKNPIKGVKPPKDHNASPPKWYTKEELIRLYNADSNYQAVWQLFVNTGLRRSEMLNLEWSNITSDTIKVISTTEARTKSSKWRMIPITNGAKIALKALRERDIKRTTVIDQITPYSLSRAFARTLNRASLTGTLHCLRHTFCSHLVMSGIPLRTVQVLAGHSTIKVTEQYAHLSDDHLQEITKVLKL